VDGPPSSPMPPVNLAARKPDPALAAVLEAVVRLKACEELAQIGTWGMAVPSGEAIWSGSTYRLLGLEPDAVEPGADVFLERIHPEDRERVERICDLMLEPDGIPEERVSGECRVIRGDGSICKLRYYGRIERGDESGPAWWVGVIRDVSDGRMVERESRDEVEARARTLSERE